VHETSLPEAMSSADLVKELSANVSLLVQRQVKLAKLELKEELKQGKSTAGLITFAGLAAYAGVIVLLVAAAIGLGEALGGRFWAGALIIGGFMLMVAAVPGLLGYKRLPKTPLARTRAELTKEFTWAKYRTT
jgi:uncharacterized membrane protein YqjE